MSQSSQFPLEIDVATLATMLKNDDDFLLLDVREVDEYEIAKIEGSRLLPMSELRNRVDELSEYKANQVVVHCHHGGRSMRVTQALRQMGFDKAQNLAGGIDQWSQEIDSEVPRY